MSRRWTIEQMVENRKKAYNLAVRYVSLIPEYREVPSYYVMGEDVLTVHPNPVIIYYHYKAKAACPQFIKNWAHGRKTAVQPSENNITAEGHAKNEAYGAIAAMILRKWGYDGYIQDELPF